MQRGWQAQAEFYFFFSGHTACSEGGKRKLDAGGDAKFVVKDEAFNYPNAVFKVPEALSSWSMRPQATRV